MWSSSGTAPAGLARAQELTRRGLDVRILHSGDAVGGRVRTDHVDGFILDRSFRVLTTAYPALPNHLDLDALDLRAFDPAGLHRLNATVPEDLLHDLGVAHAGIVADQLIMLRAEAVAVSSVGRAEHMARAFTDAWAALIDRAL